jgi:ATP-dependent RNA helicase DHX8/PRP22
VTEAAAKALEVHQSEPPGDILVFLTSPIETEQACKRLKNHPQCDDGVQLLELHGRLQSEDQQKIFDPAPAGKRKIVFATNSAETSITIPGIKYVIDTGKVREVSYDPKKNMSQLIVQWVTRSSAEQRKGRAGRTDCGKCFRLYSKAQYDDMRPDSVPEILRVHLGQALLKLMMLGIANVTDFDFVQSPDKDAIVSAMEVLKELGACDDEGAITDIGKKLSKLSLEPRLGKLALRGIEEGIAFESVVMAAVSTVGGSIFFRAGTDEQKQQADRRKTKFCDEWGDIITLVNVYREWDGLPPDDNAATSGAEK